MKNTNKKILFIFSDPGGAKPILSYIRINELENYKVVSDRKYDFFSEFNCEVEQYIVNSETKILNQFKPDCVFTATSYTSNIELKFIEKANQFGIKTISFIDHYTNFQTRFKLYNSYIYPQEIFVIDERAYKIAEDTKLTDFSDVKISGNYYHSYLKDWKPTKPRSEILKSINLKDSTLLITFAPEPLSNLDGKEKFGFDETDVWGDLTKALSSIQILRDYKLILKCHPNQNIKYLKNHIENCNFSNYIFANKIETNSLIYHSDIIIGICSNILIEANILKKSILRHLPNKTMKDSLNGMDIGNISNNLPQLIDNLEDAVSEICINNE